jgi:trk system potassium uptake protein TrkA
MFVLIIGGGKTGSSVAELLLKEKHRVVMVEHRPAIIERLRQELPPECLVVGDASLPSVLEAAGITEANVVAAVTGEDEANLVVCTLARFEYNVPRIIARVNNPRMPGYYAGDGCDVVLNEADMMNTWWLRNVAGDMMTLLKFRKVSTRWWKKGTRRWRPAMIRDLMLPPKCVQPSSAGAVGVPRDVQLQPADEVIALVHSSEAAALAALLGPAQAH